jgi:hypothetical protein
MLRKLITIIIISLFCSSAYADFVAVGSTVFHNRGCSTISKVDPTKLVVIDTYAIAIASGRKPCGTCKPVTEVIVEPNKPIEPAKTYIIGTILVQGHDCGRKFDPTMVGVPLIQGEEVTMTNEYGVKSINNATYNKELGILAIRLTPFDKGVFRPQNNGNLDQTEIDGITINSRGKAINLEMLRSVWLKGNMNFVNYAQNCDRFLDFAGNSNVSWVFVDGRWLPTVDGVTPVNPPVIEPNVPVEPNTPEPNAPAEPDMVTMSMASRMGVDEMESHNSMREAQENNYQLERLVEQLRQTDPNTIKALQKLLEEAKEQSELE